MNFRSGGSEFSVQGLEFRACGFRVWRVGLRVQVQFSRACDVCVISHSTVLGSGLRVGVGFRVSGVGFSLESAVYDL